MSDYTFSHRGGCECGGVRFQYLTDTPLTELPVRSCQCEFCRPRAALYSSEPSASLHIEVKDRRILYAHRFGTRSADFMHCARCNNLVYVRCDIAGKQYAIVVVSALAGELPDWQATAMDYEGERLQQRLSWRAECWIHNFELAEIDHAAQ